jgi:hypothetical protein
MRKDTKKILSSKITNFAAPCEMIQLDLRQVSEI